MENSVKEQLVQWAEEYNDPKYFQEDPIIFPAEMAKRFRSGECSLADVEIAAVIAAHLAWGRRSMIVRDCTRAMDEMMWKPYGYVMAGDYRDDDASLHRTVKWSEFASICNNLKTVYSERDSIEGLTNGEIRCRIYGRKEDLKAPDKKINMMRRWMVRDDGKVDLGVWKKSDKKALLIPLDVHVYDEATALGLTSRKQKDIVTVREITDAFREIFPDDPCKGDFSLLLECSQFVNSDEFAKGLSPFNPEQASIQASRYMLLKIKYLFARKEDFGIETTLATRTLLKMISMAQKEGYTVTLMYFWLNSPDLAVARVKARVAAGGHNIPEETVRRRYRVGISYFFKDYIPLCDRWILADNSKVPFRVIAEGSKNDIINIKDRETYEKIKKSAYDTEEWTSNIF